MPLISLSLLITYYYYYSLLYWAYAISHAIRHYFLHAIIWWRVSSLHGCHYFQMLYAAAIIIRHTPPYAYAFSPYAPCLYLPCYCRHTLMLPYIYDAAITPLMPRLRYAFHILFMPACHSVITPRLRVYYCRHYLMPCAGWLRRYFATMPWYLRHYCYAMPLRFRHAAIIYYAEYYDASHYCFYASGCRHYYFDDAISEYCCLRHYCHCHWCRAITIFSLLLPPFHAADICHDIRYYFHWCRRHFVYAMPLDVAAYMRDALRSHHHHHHQSPPPLTHSHPPPNESMSMPSQIEVRGNHEY